MKAITTQYYGPTANRGTRIKAEDSDGNRVWVTRDINLSVEDNHCLAAAQLCRKMGWSGDVAMGTLGPDTWVFVWVEPRTTYRMPQLSPDGKQL